MDVLDIIETPENVELEQRLAGIGSRFIAGLIDALILIAILLAISVLFYVAGALKAGGVNSLAAGLYIAVAFVVLWGYFVYFEYRTNGQTPGKKLFRIRVVREGGLPISFRDIAIRNLLRIVDGFPFLVLCVIGGFAMFISKKCQRLGDLAAGTVVVSEVAPDYSAKSDRRVLADWESEAGSAALRATGLTPEECRVLNNYWMRRGQLTLEARSQVLPGLLGPILERMGQTLADGRLETLEAYVELLMRQAWYAESQARNAPHQHGGQP